MIREPFNLNIKRSLLLMALCLPLLLFQACAVPTQSIQYTYVPFEQLSPAVHVEVEEYQPRPVAYGSFTLHYDPHSPLNPITGFSSDNLIISTLLYEPLFRLDNNLTALPVLAESWYSEDNITHIITIHPDIMMSDGAVLSAQDVVYSITQAMTTGRFMHRLQVIRTIRAIDELTLSIVLNNANRHLNNLLDVPIIRSGTIHMNTPPGTGPYIFSEYMRLYRFNLHRDYELLPFRYIRLVYNSSVQLSELFDDRVLSLVWDDPGGVFEFRLNRFHEARFYNTTRLQFLGFNTRLAALRNPDVRSAIGHSVEREYIASEILPGLSLASPLALPPSYRLYNTDWEFTAFDPFREMAALLTRAGMIEDANGLFLLYPSIYGGFQPFVIDFIVNRENQFKVRAAHRISDTLARNGINAVVRELPWEDFLHALDSGDFDMFYGEAHMSPDFDFSPLLLPNGRLNFGGVGGEEYRTLIHNFLSATTDYEEEIAARALVNDIRINAPFVPILYRRHVVYTPVGAISEAFPSQSGIFLDIANWTVNKSLLS